MNGSETHRLSRQRSNLNLNLNAGRQIRTITSIHQKNLFTLQIGTGCDGDSSPKFVQSPRPSVILLTTSTSSMSTGTPPIIPSDLLPYESYTEDPKWQIRFTAMWCAALGLAVLLAAPRALFSPRIRESARGFLGVRVRGGYESLPQEEEKTAQAPVPIQNRTVPTIAARVLGSVQLWSLPGINLNIGQSAFNPSWRHNLSELSLRRSVRYSCLCPVRAGLHHDTGASDDKSKPCG